MPATNERSDRGSCLSGLPAESSGRRRKRFPTLLSLFGCKADTINLVKTQTEIQQHGSTGVAAGKNDVVGFNVTMDHATGMACAEGCEQLSGRLDSDTDFDTGLGLAPSSKSRSLDELGRDIGLDLGVLPAEGIAFYQARNAVGANGVVSASFLEEARSPFRIAFGLDHLQESPLAHRAYAELAGHDPGPPPGSISTHVQPSDHFAWSTHIF